MAVYTKEQIELVNEIRKLSKREQEGKLNYEELIRFLELQEQAKIQLLCYW